MITPLAVQRGYLRVCVEIHVFLNTTEWSSYVLSSIFASHCVSVVSLREICWGVSWTVIGFYVFSNYISSTASLSNTTACWQHSLLHFKHSTYRLVSAGCFPCLLQKASSEIPSSLLSTEYILVNTVTNNTHPLHQTNLQMKNLFSSNFL